MNNLSTGKPNSLQIVSGDTNRCKLNLQGFIQYVDCHTRKEVILDTYCNIKDAYKSVQGVPPQEQ